MGIQSFTSNNLQTIRMWLIRIGVLLISFTILDLCCNPIYWAGIQHWWGIRTLIENKEHVYIFFHLLFVIAIFWFQEESVKQHNQNQSQITSYQTTLLSTQQELITKQNEILGKVDENVKQLAPLKKIEEINTTIKTWLQEDQANILIFYFPYSIHPGFWIDTGVYFSTFIDELRTKINQSYKSKLYFIGPDSENSPFSETIDVLKSKLDKAFVSKFISQNTEFFNTYDFENFDAANKEQWINKISTEYKEKLLKLEKLSNDKQNNFKVYKIGRGESCALKSANALPSFSFILKVNRNKAEDMIIIDTFNVVAENNLSGFLNDLGIESIWNKSQDAENEPQKLLIPPIYRILGNQHAANLFFTTFLETCCQADDFKSLRSDLINLN